MGETRIPLADDDLFVFSHDSPDYLCLFEYIIPPDQAKVFLTFSLCRINWVNERFHSPSLLRITSYLPTHFD
jgi:hypothetical protein